MEFKKDYAYDEELSRLSTLDLQLPCIANCGRNLNLAALEGKLEMAYNREEQFKQVKQILLRRNKGNILLTGAAGCGKTAIAEGLAIEIVSDKLNYTRECIEAAKVAQSEEDEFAKKSTKKIKKPLFLDYVIYELSLNSLVSGTKYRGEFEEKLQTIIDKLTKYPNVVLFIDEIHQINGIGCAGGSTSAGQILKPALARGSIRVIGATTTEESTFIRRDKALNRRFCEVIVPELKGTAAVDALARIMTDYAKYHKVKVKDVTAENLYQQIQYFMPETVFPNNAIDVIDEAMASARYEGKETVTIESFDKVISRMTGQTIVHFDEKNA